jgi:hypothetical protein
MLDAIKAITARKEMRGRRERGRGRRRERRESVLWRGTGVGVGEDEDGRREEKGRQRGGAQDYWLPRSTPSPLGSGERPVIAAGLESSTKLMLCLFLRGLHA